MMIRKGLLLVLPLTAMLGGCVIAVGNDGDGSAGWQKTERSNREEIGQLSLGISESKVRAELGNPDFTEAYRNGQDEVRVLFYRTQRQREDGITTKDECTPLVFTNDRLSGWGDKIYDDVSHR